MEKSKVKKTGRLPYLDIAKGILILCVIYCHICWASSLMDVIIGDTWQNLNKIGTHLWVPFYMPAFFIITGVCSSFDKEFKVFLQNNCITLLWPMLVITFQNHWFVYALFISKLLYYGLNKLVRNSVALWILYFVITTVACVCQNSPEIASHNRWYMLHGLSLAIYIPIGQKLRLYIDKKWLFVLSSLVYLIVILASCITNWNLPSVFSKYDVELQQLPLHFLLSVTGSLMLIGLCKLIKHNKILEYLGRNSLVIFFVHVIFITILVTYLPFNTSNELHFFGVFIASTVLSCIVAAIFDTKYLKWCLGKF